jgi:hypothetical protein
VICVVISWAYEPSAQVVGPFETTEAAEDFIMRINAEDPDEFERYARVEEMFTPEEWFNG